MISAVELASVLAAYVLGSVPTGLWLGLRLRHVDIREHGSKNIGATNTMRVLGKQLGAVALACDILKGLIPVLLAQRYGVWAYLPIACGLAAIVGHTFPIFLKFKGGGVSPRALASFSASLPCPCSRASWSLALPSPRHAWSAWAPCSPPWPWRSASLSCRSGCRSACSPALSPCWSFTNTARTSSAFSRGRESKI